MERSETTPDPSPSRSPSAGGRVTDHLANERTFLAWVRTALGLIGMGFVLARMGVFLRQLATLGQPGPRREFRGGREFLVTGVVFLALGTATTLLSGWLYHRGRRAIDEGRYQPAWRAVAALTVAVVAGGVIVTAIVIWQLVEPSE